MKDNEQMKPAEDKASAINKRLHRKSNRKERRMATKSDKFGSRMGDTSFKGPNDIRWRTGNELGTKLAATLPFNWPNGLGLESPTGNTPPSFIPGIMTIYVRLTLGSTATYNSPINLAARKCYSYVRHANSGSKNYDAVDLALMFGSIGQALGLLGYLQRAYKTICRFKVVDRYTPKDLIECMCLDYDDLLKHQAELAWLIQWLGKSISSIAIPEMAYFHACYDAFTHIYVDDESPRHQYYMLSPSHFGVYAPTYTSTGGGIDYSSLSALEPTLTRSNLLSYNAIYTLVHSIMDVLLSDEDIGIISGDILKAYGETGLFKPAPLSDEVYEPEHSLEFLEQIHNLRMIDPGFTFDGYQQAPGSPNTAPFLIMDYTNVTGLQQDEQWKWIDSFEDTPKPEAIVNATVLQCTYNLEPDGASGQQIKMSTLAFDLYLPEGIQIVIGAHPNYHVATDTWGALADNGLIDDTDFTGNDFFYVLQNFDWAPFVCAKLQVATTKQAFFGDVRNINGFNQNVMYRLHENSMLSLFGFGVGSDTK